MLSRSPAVVRRTSSSLGEEWATFCCYIKQSNMSKWYIWVDFPCWVGRCEVPVTVMFLSFWDPKPDSIFLTTSENFYSLFLESFTGFSVVLRRMGQEKQIYTLLPYQNSLDIILINWGKQDKSHIQCEWMQCKEVWNTKFYVPGENFHILCIMEYYSWDTFITFSTYWKPIQF